MAYGESNCHVTDDVTPKVQGRDPDMIRAHYLKNRAGYAIY